MHVRRRVLNRFGQRIHSALTSLLLAGLLIQLATGPSLAAQDMLDRLINLQASDQPIKSVLAQLGQQADVRFTYSPLVIEPQRRVTLRVTNQRLADVLHQLLSPLGVQYSLKGRQIILRRDETTGGLLPTPPGLASPALPADRTVTGRITDENGAGLPGANVVVKGTSRGTSSDSEGNFRLGVPDGEITLTISSIGYLSQELSLPAGQTSLTIQLRPEAKSLSEVVVTGYSAQRKKDITGSVSVVDVKALKSVPAGSAVQALQGQASGVNVVSSGVPGASSTIRIRGITSFGNTQPLVLIDGIQADLNNVSPNELPLAYGPDDFTQ